jgi:hypothetical protein
MLGVLEPVILRLRVAGVLDGATGDDVMRRFEGWDQAHR